MWSGPLLWTTTLSSGVSLGDTEEHTSGPPTLGNDTGMLVLQTPPTISQHLRLSPGALTPQCLPGEPGWSRSCFGKTREQRPKDAPGASPTDTTESGLEGFGARWLKNYCKLKCLPKRIMSSTALNNFPNSNQVKGVRCPHVVPEQTLLL